MVRIGRPVVILGVAGIAIRRRPREHVIDVAADARYSRMRSGQREGRVVVIEDRSGPRCRCMACSARGWEASRHVIWIGRSCEVCLVAGIAIRRRPGEHIIDVAAGAGHGGMCARQWEGRVVVIEDGAGPGSRRMASCTGRREASRDMIWICCSREIRLVAGIAIRRCACENIIDVAAGARHSRMRARQREGCVVVVEDRASPRCRCMASSACRREAC